MKTAPERTIAELKELRELTGDENGAQRVAFTETWATARKWLREKLEAFCPDIHADEAGNLWATLRGESPKALLIGGRRRRTLRQEPLWFVGVLGPSRHG